MKKIIWTGNDTLEYTEEARPPPEELSETEVLIRITAVGFCSTDAHIIEGKVRFVDPPMALGHELSGVIQKTGSGVTRVQPGDRVTVDPVVGCGECTNCGRST